MEAEEKRTDIDMAEAGESLSLVVREKTLGTLITNALDIRAFVERKLEEYTPERYQGDADQAAKDKAELNKAADRLNSERLALEKEFMRPFNDFKDVVNDTVGKIKTASSRLALIVDARKQAEREEKQKRISELWKEKNFGCVPLTMIQKSSWLNKTVKISAVSAEMDSIILKINEELRALDEFPAEDRELLKSIYLGSLSLPSAVEHARRLKENRERLAEEERKKAEARAADSMTSDPEMQEEENHCQEPTPPEDPPREEKADAPAEPACSVIFTGGDLSEIYRLAGDLKHENVLMVSGSRKELSDLASAVKRAGISYDKMTETVIRIKR